MGLVRAARCSTFGYYPVMTPQEIIQRFVSKQLTIVYGEHGGVERFELFHAAGDMPERLQIFPVVIGETRSDELATEIFDVANTDMQSRVSQGPERYGVLAIVTGEDGPVGQVSFQFEGRTSKFGVTFDESEPPNIKGQTSQLMRHTEEMHKFAGKMMEATVGAILAENKRLAEKVTQYEQLHEETRKLRDEALDRRDERELIQAKQLMRAKREDQLGGMLLSMAPMLLATFFGAKGNAAAASSAKELAVKQFLSELDEKEVTGIFSALTPPHQMALMQVYQSFKSEAVKEDKEKPYILRAASEDAA